jgi:flagellar basal-body rod modification protein FlgD
MQVDSATQAAANTTQQTNTASSSTSASTLDYNAFLKLLIAQMQNQDPTKPMDSTEFVAQLAAFSNVEQGIKTNSKLDSLMTSLALTQADGLIGHTITSADGKISGEVESVRITTGGAVATLTNGKEVTLEAGITVSGS